MFRHVCWFFIAVFMMACGSSSDPPPIDQPGPVASGSQVARDNPPTTNASSKPDAGDVSPPMTDASDGHWDSTSPPVDGGQLALDSSSDYDGGAVDSPEDSGDALTDAGPVMDSGPTTLDASPSTTPFGSTCGVGHPPCESGLTCPAAKSWMPVPYCTKTCGRDSDCPTGATCSTMGWCSP